MTTVEHQDSDLVILNPLTFNGVDIYLKQLDPFWSYSTIGNDYRVLIDRRTGKIIEADNEYYQQKYSDIETSLVGDVLILGMGLAILDQFLATGSSWKWIEINEWIYNNVSPVNGTVARGDANDLDFLSFFGTFDTILIDFPYENPLTDYASLLNPAGNVIEFKL